MLVKTRLVDFQKGSAQPTGRLHPAPAQPRIRRRPLLVLTNLWFRKQPPLIPPRT